jgi:hypothetical protein
MRNPKRTQSNIDWLQEFENVYSEKNSSSDMKSMLQLISPGTSIIVDENIGLLGNNMKIANNNSLLDLTNNLPINSKVELKRGTAFDVIDNEGCILFDEKVILTGVIEDRSANDKYYIFGLGGYYIKDNVLDFFDQDDFGFNSEDDMDKTLYENPALILYKADANELYTNSPELKDKYIYNDRIRIDIRIKDILFYNGNQQYIGIAVSKENKIYEFKEVHKK